MARKRVRIWRAANGFHNVTTASLRESLRLRGLLTFRYGFLRWGEWIPGIADEAIHPSFIRGAMRILAGWDNWFGYYLLADDAEADQFLLRFHAKHVASRERPA